MISGGRVARIAVSACLSIGALAGPAAARTIEPEPGTQPRAASCTDRRNAPTPPRLTPGKASLDPTTIERSLPAGGEATIPVTLDLPATPTALDVFIIIDTTGSMDDVLCSVRTGLADVAVGLWKRGIDVHFGVGEYRDYEAPNGTGDFAYRRLRDIGPPDQDLIDTLQGMRTGAGGNEPALTAFFQAATGAGEDIFPAGDSVGDVPPGHEASFRSESLKVIILATDERFRHPSSGVGPTWEETTDALRARDIIPVGIGIGGDPLPDLMRLAEEMNVFAPPGGIDCDGDGIRDIRANEPLACRVPRGAPGTMNLVPTILNLLDGVTDESRIRLSASGDLRTLRSITPSAPVADLRSDNRLRYSVRFECGELPPDTTVLTLSARVRGEVVATTRALITCEPTPAIPTFIVRAAPVAGAETPAQQPATQPQPQAQPNSAANPNAAMVPQFEPNPALAEVRASDDLAMSARRESASPAYVFAAGLIACTIAWFAAAHAPATAPATQPRRKR